MIPSSRLPGTKEERSALLLLAQAEAEAWQSCAKTQQAGEALIRAAGHARACEDLHKCRELLVSAWALHEDTDKPVYAVDQGKRILKEQARIGCYADVMRTAADMTGMFTALKQPHNVAKMVLVRVILLLADDSEVLAQREFHAAIGYVRAVPGKHCVCVCVCSTRGT